MSLRAPLLVGEVIGALVGDFTGVAADGGEAVTFDDPVLMPVPAAQLTEGDVIPSWPDGTVTRSASALPGGRVEVEISGTTADLDATEYVETLRHYEAAIPGAFVAAASVCYPDGLPGVLGERRALELFGCVDLILRVTYAEKIELADLAALIWWECLQESGDEAAALDFSYCDAARMVAQGPPTSGDLSVRPVLRARVRVRA